MHSVCGFVKRIMAPSAFGLIKKILTYFSPVLFTDHLSSNHSSYETNMPVSGRPL